MDKTFKGIQISLVIAISLLILTLPAYLRRTQLSQSKFASSDLSFENPGQEEGLPDSQKELKVLYGSNTLLISFHFPSNLFEESFHLFSQKTFSLCQEALILRC